MANHCTNPCDVCGADLGDALGHMCALCVCERIEAMYPATDRSDRCPHCCKPLAECEYTPVGMATVYYSCDCRE